MGNPSDPRVTEIHNLLEHRANASYGLHGITQREHALQTVMFAGHPSAFIAAALLQDIGRLLHQLGHVPTAESVDDGHEAAGHRYLARWFAPQLTEPVRLHVAAKRYLCATELGYFGKLSADSVLSLVLQEADVADRNRGVLRHPALARSRTVAPLRRSRQSP